MADEQVLAEPGSPVFTEAWLELRADADAEARARRLLALLPRTAGTPVVADLGAGTGSMARWLAPRLPRPQQWVLYDNDPALLERAAARLRAPGRTVRTRCADLRDAELRGVTLVVASALLDLLTPDHVRGLAARCARQACPALFALSVDGTVRFDPSDPLDAEIGAAFNAHQRRGGLLGPDAVAVATEAFERAGMRVHTCPSPWRLGAHRAALTATWLRGRCAAAAAQRPELAGPIEDYLSRRLGGRLPDVAVGHTDLLAVPGVTPR